MSGPYTQLLWEDLHYESVRKKLHHLLENKIYEPKALRAYIRYHIWKNNRQAKVKMG